MEDYEVRIEIVSIGGRDYKIRLLKDRQQYSDLEGIAEQRGISSANWPLFGIMWPSGIILAQLISELPLQELRILEVGCGLGIASMVASQRGADITASDNHPLAETFLDSNVALNGVPGIKFINSDWGTPITRAGKFGLIIGSDLLYEQTHPALLSVFIDCHATADAKVIICDPGRRQVRKFSQLMIQLGFSLHTELIPPLQLLGQKYKGKILTYERNPEIPRAA